MLPRDGAAAAVLPCPRRQRPRDGTAAPSLVHCTVLAGRPAGPPSSRGGLAVYRRIYPPAEVVALELNTKPTTPRLDMADFAVRAGLTYITDHLKTLLIKVID